MLFAFDFSSAFPLFGGVEINLITAFIVCVWFDWCGSDQNLAVTLGRRDSAEPVSVSKGFEVLLVSSAKHRVLAIKSCSFNLISACASGLPPQAPVYSESCFRRPDLCPLFGF